MGEMIKFGIKMAMTIACAIALVAAIALLFSSISDVLSGFSIVSIIRDVARIIQVYIPINVYLIFTLITTLGSFKVAYWAADKMIQFIEALG